MPPFTSSWLRTGSRQTGFAKAGIPTRQPVCIIEAMKLMNEFVVEVSGKIVKIVVENSQSVEFGQRSMRVKPS